MQLKQSVSTEWRKSALLVPAVTKVVLKPAMFTAYQSTSCTTDDPPRYLQQSIAGPNDLPCKLCLCNKARAVCVQSCKFHPGCLKCFR